MCSRSVGASYPLTRRTAHRVTTVFLDGSADIVLTMKPTTQFNSAYTGIAKERQVARPNLTLAYNGVTINNGDTPLSLKMPKQCRITCRTTSALPAGASSCASLEKEIGQLNPYRTKSGTFHSSLTARSTVATRTRPGSISSDTSHTFAATHRQITRSTS